MTSFDMSDTIAPKSDQLDAVDLVSGDRTFTISGVSRGNDEQPVQFALAEFPRVWRPGLSMRRVLVACWGKDASTYVGRRVQLYCDPDVQFGGAAVGGTRIRALSHIDKPKAVPLLIKRGKSAMFVVQPLADTPAPSKTVAAAGALTVEEFIEDARTADDEAQLNVIARKAVAALSGADLERVKAVVTACRAKLKEPLEATLDWPATAPVPE